MSHGLSLSPGGKPVPANRASHHHQVKAEDRSCTTGQVGNRSARRERSKDRLEVVEAVDVKSREATRVED